MADPPRYPDSGDGPGVGSGRGSATGTPRWVKVLGIIAAVVVLLVAILLLTGGGGHGPRRHTPAGGLGPPFSVTAAPTAAGGLGSHAPPEGGHR